MCIRMSDSGFRIRVDDELRKEFIETCRSQDRPAAQVLRDFMRVFIKKNRGDSSGDTPNDHNTRMKVKGRQRQL